MFAPTLVAETAIGVFEVPVEFGCGPGEGGFDIGGLSRDDEGGVVFWTGLEETAFVSWSGLFVGFAGEGDFDASQIRIESMKDVDDVGSDGIGELVVHRDRVVAVDLNLHGLSFCYFCTKT